MVGLQRIASGVALLVVLAGNAAGQQAQSPEALAELPATVRETLSVLPSPRKPAAILRELVTESSGVGRTNATVSYTYLDGGIWQIIEKIAAGTTVGVNQTLSLYGIVELISTLDVVRTGETAGVIPLGKGFIPFSSRQSTNITVVNRTTQLDGGLGSLAQPSVGASFELRHAWERVVQRGLRNAGKVIRFERNVGCRTSEPRDASTLHPDLVGVMLTIDCAGKDVDGRPISSQHGYLEAYGLHIPLTIQDRVTTERIKILRVDHEIRP